MTTSTSGSGGRRGLPRESRRAEERLLLVAMCASWAAEQCVGGRAHQHGGGQAGQRGRAACACWCRSGGEGKLLDAFKAVIMPLPAGQSSKVASVNQQELGHGVKN